MLIATGLWRPWISQIEGDKGQAVQRRGVELRAGKPTGLIQLGRGKDDQIDGATFQGLAARRGIWHDPHLPASKLGGAEAIGRIANELDRMPWLPPGKHKRAGADGALHQTRVTGKEGKINASTIKGSSGNTDAWSEKTMGRQQRLV